MITAVREFLERRELLYMLTWRDIRIRYKQSVMGLMWAILMPALVVGAGVLVRVLMSQWSGQSVSPTDIMSVLVRGIAWAFVVGAVRFGTNSLVSNSALVTKISFPKEVFPFAAVISNLFDYAVAAAASVVVLLMLGWTPSLTALWFFPLILILVLLISGMCLALSAANLFYRDVKYLIEVFLTYAIFFTPVLYDASMLGKWQNVVMLNPIAPILEGMATSIVRHTQPDLAWVGYSAAVSIVLFIVGFWSFKRLESRFAESI